MKRWIMSAALVAILTPAAALTAARAGSAPQDECPPEQIRVVAAADSILVQHTDAERNCCTELVVTFNIEGSTVNFFEAEVGSPCRCLCCYDSAYEMHGLAPGRYDVCIWGGTGEPQLLATVPVDVLGAGTAPVMGSVQGGVCLRTPTSQSSWGTLRILYR